MPNPTIIENTLEKKCLICFAKKVSNILTLPLPKLVYDSTKTELATYFPAEDTIVLNNQVPKSHLFFAVSHELRHQWQMLNNFEFFFSDYKELDECNSPLEYDLQIAEVDANAFAKLIIMALFDITASYKHSAFYERIINKRMDEILDELSIIQKRIIFNDFIEDVPPIRIIYHCKKYGTVKVKKRKW